MKTQYESINLNAESRALVTAAEDILESFGVTMTVRQLYYQLVTRNLIPNTVQSYKRVVRIMRDARMGGLLDWDHIEDRLREPRVPPSWASIDSIIRAATTQFKLDRWVGQRSRIEVWLEKDALAGIVGSITSRWQVTLQVNRGYSSVTAMREAALRLIAAQRAGCDVTIGYLGDHDPSGEDMVRDVRDRLATFGARVFVQKLAIMQDDIAEYNLPPQPVKDSDARAEKFRAAHGDECVELDALRPDVLEERVEAFIRQHLDLDEWQLVLDEEERQRASVKVARRG
jgi:hypothetical protein